MNNNLLINIAYIYKERAIEAIENSLYATKIDAQCESMVMHDINDFLYIVQNNDLDKLKKIDSDAFDILIDILKDEFKDIDIANILLMLATSVTRSMYLNNEARNLISNYDARKTLDEENTTLQRLNTVLCNYARTYEK